MLRPGSRSIGWDRDPTVLFDHLRAIVPDERLTRVAASDYGWRADENLAELRAMCATGRLPRPLLRSLDVLQLERFGGADEGLELDHASRALACTILLADDAAGGTPLNEGGEGTLIMLVESALALDQSDAAIQLVAALADAYDPRPLALFADLALVILAYRRDPADPRIAVLLSRLDDEVTDEWVLGLTQFRARHGAWHSQAWAVPPLASRFGYVMEADDDAQPE
jgi:hypothetical protein